MEYILKFLITAFISIAYSGGYENAYGPSQKQAVINQQNQATAGGTAPTAVGTGDAKPEIPEFRRAYSLGVGINSLIGGYYTQQIEYLREYAAQGDEDKQLEILGDYCALREDINQCRRRFIAARKADLYRIENGLILNEAMISKLKCNEYNAQGKCTKLEKSVFQANGVDPNTQQVSQIPLLPTYADLIEIAKKQKSEQKISEDDYNEWIAANFYNPNAATANAANAKSKKALVSLKRPDCKDFVKYKVVGTPGTEDEHYIIERDSNGVAVPDQARCKIAQEEFDKRDKKNLEDSYQVIGKSVPTRESLSADRKAALEALSKSPKNAKEGADDENYHLYGLSRGPLAQVANESIAKAAKSKKSVDTKKRDPSAKEKNNEPASKSPPLTSGEGADTAVTSPQQKGGQSTEHTVSYSPGSFSPANVKKMMEADDESHVSRPEDYE